MLFESCSVLVLALLVFQQMSIDSYMDEIFHVPQALLICNGDFQTWDPKITTFPGLYYFSCSLSAILKYLKIVTESSVSLLRLINFATSFLILFSSKFYWIQLNRGTNRKLNSLIPSLVYLYPISAFYFGLYYTDTFSTAMVLLLLYYLNANFFVGNNNFQMSFFQHIAALIFATMAILARQTNVLWILFCIGIACEKDFSFQSKTNEDGFKQLVAFAIYLVRNIGFIIKKYWSLMLPVIIFLMFVYINGGIVVGDKENHVPTVHFAMISHCLAIIGLLSFPNFIAVHVFKSSQPTSKNGLSLKWSLGLGAIISLGMVFGSKSHPFLLSDNRHLSFYIWRWFLSKTFVRWAIFPLYTISIAAVFDLLSRRENPIWILIFLIAMALSLLPTPLLEFRYFTVPIIIGFIHVNKVEVNESQEALALKEMIYTFIWVLFIAVNVATTYIFLYRTYYWPDGSLARFMY